MNNTTKALANAHSIELYEDNGGGLHLAILSEGIVIHGLEQAEEARLWADCRGYGVEWTAGSGGFDTSPVKSFPTWDIDAPDAPRLVATYTPDGIELENTPHRAARRYIGLDRLDRPIEDSGVPVLYSGNSADFRAVYWTDGQGGEVLLTTEEEAHLSDGELWDIAEAQAAEVELDTSYGDIRLGYWRDSYIRRR